jgi:hypothetical protein
LIQKDFFQFAIRCHFCLFFNQIEGHIAGMRELLATATLRFSFDLLEAQSVSLTPRPASADKPPSHNEKVAPQDCQEYAANQRRPNAARAIEFDRTEYQQAKHQDTRESGILCRWIIARFWQIAIIYFLAVLNLADHEFVG